MDKPFTYNGHFWDISAYYQCTEEKWGGCDKVSSFTAEARPYAV